MRILALLISLIPIHCLALGADSVEYAGISPDGKVVKIEFYSDPEKWTGGNFIYGSENPTFKYCWLNQVPIDKTNPQYSAREYTHFVCTSERESPPTVFYKRSNRTSEHPGIRQQEAMDHFQKLGHHTDVMLDYYVCDKGCDSSMPLFMFELSFVDC